MMDRVCKLHAAGQGNGQFLAIIDFGSLSTDLTCMGGDPAGMALH